LRVDDEGCADLADWWKMVKSTRQGDAIVTERLIESWVAEVSMVSFDVKLGREEDTLEDTRRSVICTTVLQSAT
jgi:hypothetical protein